MSHREQKEEKRPLYQAVYCYTPELIRSFSRIHLWYHCRQHPLLIQAPGIFLAGCLLWKILQYGMMGKAVEMNDLITIVLIGLFTCIMLWLGFVHPYVFRRTLCQNLEGPAGGRLFLEFYQEHIRAKNAVDERDYTYKNARSCYVTPDCIYLYMANNQALLVPFESLDGKNSQGLETFLLDRLSCRIENKRHIIRRTLDTGTKQD